MEQEKQDDGDMPEPLDSCHVKHDIPHDLGWLDVGVWLLILVVVLPVASVVTVGSWLFTRISRIWGRTRTRAGGRGP